MEVVQTLPENDICEPSRSSTQSLPLITFTDAKFIGNDPTQDDTMVVTIVIAGWVVWKKLIGKGSFANILYWFIFGKLDASHDLIQPHEKPIIGFIGERVYVRGKIDLSTTFGSRKLSQSLTVPYVSVDADILYNVLLGMPILNKLRAIVSTSHLAMKFSSSTGQIVFIKANQVDAHECYVKCCKIEPYNMVK